MAERISKDQLNEPRDIAAKPRIHKSLHETMLHDNRTNVSACNLRIAIRDFYANEYVSNRAVIIFRIRFSWFYVLGEDMFPSITICRTLQKLHLLELFYRILVLKII